MTKKIELNRVKKTEEVEGDYHLFIDGRDIKLFKTRKNGTGSSGPEVDKKVYEKLIKINCKIIPDQLYFYSDVKKKVSKGITNHIGAARRGDKLELRISIDFDFEKYEKVKYNPLVLFTRLVSILGDTAEFNCSCENRNKLKREMMIGYYPTMDLTGTLEERINEMIKIIEKAYEKAIKEMK